MTEKKIIDFTGPNVKSFVISLLKTKMFSFGMVSNGNNV